jgi:DNA-binding response OmpR family regulator
MVTQLRKPERINLSQAGVLIACGDADGLSIMTQMFAGFGVHTPRCCATGREAMDAARERELNLVVVDAQLNDGPGEAFIRNLRVSGLEPNATAPIVFVLGHTTPSLIRQGRDAGASFVVRKPIPPVVMMQRIIWLLNDERKFINAPGYAGPDRRVRALGPPAGMKGRRHDDLSIEVGRATTPNLDQNEIDALFQPRAAAL